MSSPDDAAPELALVALAAIVQHVEDGHGDRLIHDFVTSGRIVLRHDGITVVVVSVVAYPITRPEGDGHDGST